MHVMGFAPKITILQRHEKRRHIVRMGLRVWHEFVDLATSPSQFQHQRILVVILAFGLAMIF